MINKISRDDIKGIKVPTIAQINPSYDIYAEHDIWTNLDFLEGSAVI